MDGGTEVTPLPWADSFVSEAALVLRNRDRVNAHSSSELHPDVEGILATVSPPDQYRWSGGCLAWALCTPDPDGRPEIMTRTTWDAVREFYEWRVSQDLPGPLMEPQTEYTSSWYGFTEQQPQLMYDPVSGAPGRTIYPVSILAVDGTVGISSEIVWLLGDNPGLGIKARAAIWTSYLAGLREQDPDKLANLMTPDVQGAVRDYSGLDPDFIHIDGREAMRGHYRRFFEKYEVCAVRELLHFLRDSFVFHELMVDVRPRAGRQAGSNLSFRLAEILTYDASGLFQGRVGYGTSPEES